MLEPEVYKVAGEVVPYISGSKTCLERLGRTIILYGLKVKSSHYFTDAQGLSARSSVIVSLAIPASKLDLVEKALRCKLIDHLDIQLGMECYPSVKWRDVDEKRYYSPYPSKESPLKSPKVISKIDFETKLQELFDEGDGLNSLQMLCIMKFALDMGIFTEDDYKSWRPKAKSL